MRASIVVWGGVALLGASMAWANETEKLQVIGKGRGLYLTHCASCHGMRGLGARAEGGGSVPDLTLIGHRDGKFDALHVSVHVGNRSAREPMPKWERALAHDNNGVPADLDVYRLTRYLEWLQRPDQYAALADAPPPLP